MRYSLHIKFLFLSDAEKQTAIETAKNHFQFMQNNNGIFGQKNSMQKFAFFLILKNNKAISSSIFVPGIQRVQ